MAITFMHSKLPHLATTIFTKMSQMAEQYQAINLGQGFPDFSIPPSLHLALQQAIVEQKNQYAPMIGVLALRQAIAKLVADKYLSNIDYDSEITITSGATEALFNTFAALVMPGDEVILLDPCYDSYAPVIQLFSGVAKHVPLTYQDGKFSVDWQQVKDALTSRTKIFCFNTPHNPTGMIWQAEDIKALRDLLSQQQFYLLADDVYEHIIFDQAEHQSLLLYPDLAEQAIIVSSFGKTFHCTGWKIGYTIAPVHLTQEIRKVHQYNTFSSNSLAQFALASALNQREHLDRLGEFYQQKREYFRQQLAGSAWKLLPVSGSYFQLVDYSAISELDQLRFSEILCQHFRLAGIPLRPFYQQAPSDQYLIRFCFAKADSTLKKAGEILSAISANDFAKFSN